MQGIFKIRNRKIFLTPFVEFSQTVLLFYIFFTEIELSFYKFYL